MSRSCVCELAGNREVRYAGDLTESIAFVFESPGAEELRRGEPVVGPAGQRWMKVIGDFGFVRTNGMIINASRCRLDKKRLTDKQIRQIIASCRDHVVTALDSLKPKVIVAYGGIASHCILRTPISGVMKRRGTWQWSEEFDCYVLHTMHPSATLRNEATLPLLMQDMSLLKEFVDNDYKFREPEEKEYYETSSIQEVLDQTNIQVSIDTETQGLAWDHPDFICISYSVSDAYARAYNVILWEEIPLTEVATPRACDKQIIWPRDGADHMVYLRKADDFEFKMEQLEELCGREDIKKYCMTNYDKHVLESMDIEIKGYAMDIGIAAHVLDSELYLNARLEFLEQQLSDIDSRYNSFFADTFRKEDMLWSLRKDRDAFNFYSCADADGTRRVAKNIRERLLEDTRSANYYVHLVHPVTTQVLYGIEKNGMYIDSPALPRVEADLTRELISLEGEAIQMIPGPVRVMEEHINRLDVEEGRWPLNRRRLIADTLFSDAGFGLTPLSFTAKTQEPQVSKDILRRIMSSAPARVRDFIEKKFERDALHTVLTRYLNNIQEYLCHDSRVRPSMSITFTSSGRVGARQPNTMNIPVRGRQAEIVQALFVAPPGKGLLHIDINQSELRWIAHESRDPRMVEAYQNDEDLHEVTAKGMLAIIGVDYDSLAPDDKKAARQNAKPANFGLSYLMGLQGYIDYAMDSYGIRLRRNQAAQNRTGWFNLYSGISPWHDECRQRMYRDGCIRSAFGRVRHLPNLYAQEEWKQKEAERIGVNFIIQNPSSDMVLLSASQMYDEGFIDRPEIMLINFGHDSLTFEVGGNDGYIAELATEVIDRVTNVDTSAFGFRLSVPMKADAEVGGSLATLEEVSL